MQMKSAKLLLSLLFLGFTAIKAQHNVFKADHSKHIDHFRFQSKFDKDSVSGFNEIAAIEQAKMNGFYEDWQQQRFIAILKRNFIDKKYNLNRTSQNGDPSVQAPCTNPDFETGTAAGWTSLKGDNDNSLTMAMSNTVSPSPNVAIVNAGTFDVNLGGTVLPCVDPSGGGNYACRLGLTSGGGYSHRISQTFQVTPSNSVFIYKYAVVLEDGSHQCDEQPFFNISFVDGNGNPIQCGSYFVNANGSGCSNSSGSGSSFITSGVYQYKPWSTAAFDLTSYIGQNVTIAFTVAGCVITQGAHAGYAYIDGSCKPMTLNLNGTDIPVGQNNSSFCGAAGTNTLCAPPGFTYSWTGPGVTGQTGQCVNANADGTYSVSLGLPGILSCPFNPILYSSFVSSPSPTISSTVVQPICASPVGSATINVASGTAPYSYSWTPGVTDPSASANNAIPPGTDYTVTVTDSLGCTGTTTLSINSFTAAPSYTLDAVPGYVLSCADPSVTITFAPTSTNTSTSWEGPGGVIPGTSTVVTTPGTYTYTAINTTSSCSVTSTFDVTGNITVPTASYVASCNVSTITIDGTPTSSSSDVISWEGPNGSLPNPATVTTTGVYTLTVTDPNSGCSNTYTVDLTDVGAPTISVTTVPGNSLTCSVNTIQATASSNNSNATFTWLTPTSGTNTINPETITSPGTYTAVATNPNTGCYSYTFITIGTNTTTPIVTINGGTVVPCSTGSLSLNASSSSATTFTWSNGTNGANNSITSGGSYTVTGTDPANGCTSTATITVSQETVTASFTATPTNGEQPLPVSFTNGSTNATNYDWSFGDGNGSSLSDPTHVYGNYGDYSVVLIASNGVCSDTATSMIHVTLVSSLTVPNVFTPNGDGKNDLFTLNAVNIGSITLTIFDRWGLKMYEETKNGSAAWDGKNKSGKLVPDGTYFYIIKATGLDDKAYDLSGFVQMFTTN